MTVTTTPNFKGFSIAIMMSFFLIPPISQTPNQLRMIQGRAIIRDAFLGLGLDLILDKHVENREMEPSHRVMPHPRKIELMRHRIFLGRILASKGSNIRFSLLAPPSTAGHFFISLITLAVSFVFSIFTGHSYFTLVSYKSSIISFHCSFPLLTYAIQHHLITLLKTLSIITYKHLSH